MPLALLRMMWLSARPHIIGVPAPRRIESLLLACIATFSLTMVFLALKGMRVKVTTMICTDGVAA